MTRRFGVSPEGLALLDAYSADHVFLHDDFDPTYPTDDWEGYDTAPLLLRGETIAYDNPALDSAFLARLADLGFAAPVHFLAPRPPSVSLAVAIAQNSRALARLADIRGSRHISVFENRLDQEGSLARALGAQEAISPTSDHFRTLNSKVAAYQRLQELDLPIPFGRICDSRQDLELFIAAESALSHRVVLKAGHRRLAVLSCVDELAACIAQLGLAFPVLAERFIPHATSPIVQAVRWAGRTEVLCGSLQRHEVFRHAGNSWPMEDPDSLLIECVTVLADTLPPDYGVLGLDFIVTSTGPLVVDVNPRFCSSTYPQVAYAHLGFCEEPATTGHIRTRDRRSFERLLEFAPPIGRATPGVLLYCPMPIGRDGVACSYMAVGESRDEVNVVCKELEEGLW